MGELKERPEWAINSSDHTRWLSLTIGVTLENNLSQNKCLTTWRNKALKMFNRGLFTPGQNIIYASNHDSCYFIQLQTSVITTMAVVVIFACLPHLEDSVRVQTGLVSMKMDKRVMVQDKQKRIRF